MKKIASIIRFVIISALFTLGVVMTFCEPLESSATWYADFILTKAAAVGFFALLHLVCRKWRETENVEDYK